MKISYKAAFFVLVRMDLLFHRFVQETTVAGRVNASRLSGFKVALPLCTTRLLHHVSENEFLIFCVYELHSAESIQHLMLVGCSR